MAVALLVAGLLLWKPLSGAATGQWPKADCVIKQCALKLGEEDYQIEVDYQYTVEGRTFHGTKVGMDDDNKYAHVDQAQAVVRQFPVGSAAVCYYDPSDRTRAVLQVPSVWQALWALIPLAIAVGVGFAFRMVLRSGREGEQSVSERAMRGTKLGRRGAQAFGLIFALIGGGAGLPFFAIPLWKIQAAKAWVPTPCLVESGRITVHSGSKGGSTYGLLIRYQYQYGGEKFLGDRYNFATGTSSSRGWREEALRAYPPRKQSTCYVNPSAPWESVLVPEIGPDVWFGLIPLLFVVVGLAIFFGGRRAGQLPTPLGIPKATGKPKVRVQAGLREEPEEPEERGERVLEPFGTPAGKFGCAVIAAVIWNSVVWGFILGTHPDSGGKVILGVTGFIGVVIAGASIYLFLTLFNPKPILTLLGGSLRLGETVEIRYRFEGKPDRIARLFISLDAREEATYRRGTDTITDRSYFFDAVLMDTRERGDISTGTLRVSFPPGLMHSFEAANNKVKWTLRVRGDIPKWPDVDFEYPITVLPLEPDQAIHLPAV